MLTSEVRKHSNELWRKGRVWLKVTGDVTELKIIKRMRQAHCDIDQARWHAQQIRPRSPFSTARNENTFVLFCSSMCKSKCQIHHIRPAGNHSKWNSVHTHREWALVGACKSSRGHMERWNRLISDRHAGEGIEVYVNPDTVSSLVLRLQRPFTIRRDHRWYELAKHVSNKAFDIITII